jgi:hypothetical protein
MYLGDVLAPNLILKTSTPKEIKGDSRGFSIGLEGPFADSTSV